jgi:hypothetical protein
MAVPTTNIGKSHFVKKKYIFFLQYSKMYLSDGQDTIPLLYIVKPFFLIDWRPF